MSRFDKRRVIGRKIVAVEMNPFPDGHGRTTYDPTFILDNGAKLYFITHELENANGYGIDP